MISADPIDTLVELFPRLFRGQRPGSFSCLPEGWVKLLSKLFDDLNQMLDDDNAGQFEVCQIKEKFGRLRVHFWLGPPFAEDDAFNEARWSPKRQQISDRISAAGDESEGTCEQCGTRVAAPKLNADPITLCNPCWAFRSANED